MISETNLGGSFLIDRFPVNALVLVSVENNFSEAGKMMFIRDEIAAKILSCCLNLTQSENTFVETNLRSKECLRRI